MIIVFARGALRKGPEALLDMRLFRSGVFPVSADAVSAKRNRVRHADAAAAIPHQSMRAHTR